MTSKAEELAKRLVRSWREEMSSQSLEAQLVAALREYGAEVRKRDAEVCRNERLVDSTGLADDIAYDCAVNDCAASIEREKLP